ncbi:ribonuclease H2 subunit C [Malaya genurostris]|uniref:ribonuclease H2 subunit C n=1 Tax=Malaya genurostris TaxID=325434 RepID=UPI0026F381D7|nr:ribonuclease H2 subunit C [Malaya genurostris]
MSINLKFKPSDVDTSFSNPPKLHYIPATIRGDGPAKVDQYFESYTEQLEDETLVNSLRGFPLRGKQINLPIGYSGLIFQETQKPLSSEEDRNFSFGGAFKRFTYWNYDKIPSKNDPFVKALDWMELAEALHEPISVNKENKLITKKE